MNKVKEFWFGLRDGLSKVSYKESFKRGLLEMAVELPCALMLLAALWVVGLVAPEQWGGIFGGAHPVYVWWIIWMVISIGKGIYIASDVVVDLVEDNK